jgi:hypothetical protein
MVRKAMRLPAVLGATGWAKPTLYAKIADGKFSRGTKLDLTSRAGGWSCLPTWCAPLLIATLLESLLLPVSTNLPRSWMNVSIQASANIGAWASAASCGPRRRCQYRSNSLRMSMGPSSIPYRRPRPHLPRDGAIGSMALQVAPRKPSVPTDRESLAHRRRLAGWGRAACCHFENATGERSFDAAGVAETHDPCDDRYGGTTTDQKHQNRGAENNRCYLCSRLYVDP